MLGFRNRPSAALGDDSSSVSSSEIPGGASEELFQAERREVSLANLTRSCRQRMATRPAPRIIPSHLTCLKTIQPLGKRAIK
jgi:hypothetical protein